MITADPRSRPRSVVLALEGRALHTSHPGLPVLLRAIAAPGIVWFSESGGARVLACGAKDPLPDLTVGVPVRGTVTRLLGDDASEYELTTGVSQHFAGVAPGVYWELANHEERWASLEPASEEVVHRALQELVEQLGVAGESVVRWEAVPRALSKVLRAYGALRVELVDRTPRLATISVEVPSAAERGGGQERPLVLSSEFERIGRLELELRGSERALHSVTPRPPGKRD